jgi:Zn ribbon nucleic-acid-binding protein
MNNTNCPLCNAENSYRLEDFSVLEEDWYELYECNKCDFTTTYN